MPPTSRDSPPRAPRWARSRSGYWRIVAPAYADARGTRAERSLTGSFEQLALAARSSTALGAPLARIETALAAFRAAPLTEAELVQRAGQLDRFLRLVPIEYGRGVKDGRVTLDFEIQEAVTFRDGAASAFTDLRPTLASTDARATARLSVALDELGTALADAARGDAVADPDVVRATTDEALGLIAALYPSAWKEAAETADFDVIAATLDRLQAAAAAGDWKQAEQARLEAYGIFELGPEQRLRGLAPSLFQEVEGYFWYGAEGYDGLVQLLGRHAPDEEISTTRAALDDALARSEQQIGSGPQSDVSVVTNAAIIVFREGLEAVLILAALMASLVGAQRHYRRPMFVGVGLALVASALTWVVAQTVLTSLAVYGEKLEAIVSLVAIGVLLLILNWFYHRVYWQENLQGLHQKKRRVLAGAGLSLATAQVVGLVLLGFSSVYREGFETVLFLQAMTLEAGAVTVLEGVLFGLAAVVAVFVLVIALERKLPHKKMLMATGLLITWVLVVMVGTTVQTMQKVGWVAVTPIEGLELPYWMGLWLGIFPTWQGVLAQAAAVVFVLGSYVAAEALRKRRRATRLAAASAPLESPLASVGPDAVRLRRSSAWPSPSAPARRRLGERLAARAEPGPAAADAGLRDRGAAARAWLAVAAVDAELVLHRSGSPVGGGVVLQRRALALDARPERSPDGPGHAGDLVRRELVRRALRVDARAPERLVRVDVPESRDDPLVEEDGLERRAAAAELIRQPPRRESRPERLRPVLRREVRVELGALEHEPRPEAPHVAVGESRTVVELEHRALVRHGLPVEATRHAEVHEEPEAALEPEQQVLPAPLDGDDAIALELLRDLEEIVRPSQARIEDLHARERPTFQARRELRPDGLDLGEFWHYATTSSRIPCTGGASSPISYAAATASTARAADSSSRAWTSASTCPASTVWPRFALHTTPTAWSISSSFVRRPPPSSSAAMPMGRAASRVTTPDRGARTSLTTGARGSASRSGSPLWALIQRSYVSRAEPSVIARSARSRPSGTSIPRSESASRREQASSTSSVRSGGPSPEIVSTASRTSSALPTAAPSG